MDKSRDTGGILYQKSLYDEMMIAVSKVQVPSRCIRQAVMVVSTSPSHQPPLQLQRTLSLWLSASPGALPVQFLQPRAVGYWLGLVPTDWQKREAGMGAGEREAQ